MKWVGLTGGIGSGKSTVAEILRKNGIPVIDADALSHEMTQKNAPGFHPVVAAFGSQILNSQGEIDRRRLGEIVFKEEKKLRQLESILHPLIQERAQQLRKKLENQGEIIGIYDVPLLFEKKMEKFFDAIIVVSCSESTQIRRGLARGNLSQKELEARIRAQMPLAEKVKKATYVIDNEGPMEELEKQVTDIIGKLKESNYHAQE